MGWLMLSGCSSVGKLTESELESGKYHTRTPGGSGKSTVYVEVQGDSADIVALDNNGNSTGTPVRISPGQMLRKPSFDIDVLVIVFKYRPELPSLPSQLTTDFNGNVFFGYRNDWFTLHEKKTPLGVRRRISQKSISVGVFGGLGTTFISPWTTNNQTTDEYSGFILTKGISAMLGVRSLTVGLGIGWDNLVDRDKDIWIYQYTPWYGLTLSLNLN